MISTFTAIVLGILVIAVIGIMLFLYFTNPSLSRDWSPDQSVMPAINFLDNGKVHITNIRDINYRTTRDYDLQHYDREIDPDDITSAWLAISPFGGFGAAHAFLSFGFSDDTYLSISIEIRRKKRQKFNPFTAFVRQFEIMYVIAEESDVIKVRTNCVKFPVRLYPVQTERKLMRAVFMDVLERADKLGKDPEFYNTLWNNCTTNIIKHARKFSDKPIPIWDIRYLLPDNLDKIAYKLNMIDTHLSYSAARKHFDITATAQEADDSKDFSKDIRKNIVTRPILESH